MELVSFAKEALQNVAEHAASYRLGQSVLRHLDRALWVVEKSARWAVPPPLDQDDRPQPELVRPLPWVFFLVLLMTLRITRESISLLNLVMGKPPLRSADVVMYIQSKRRYLRTLKYQGSRMMRARTAAAPQPWLGRLHALLRLAMCFRRETSYGNNNTTHVSHNDEVLVVKRSKRGRQEASPATSETTMERLIEKMMVDLDADSDDDSSFTLTNVTSIRSDRSESSESDQETILHHENNASTPSKSAIDEPRRTSVEITFTPNKSAVSTPERIDSPKHENENNVSGNSSTKDVQENNKSIETAEDAALKSPIPKPELSPKAETQLFLQTETRTTPRLSAKTEHKTANGAVASASGKRKGLNSERRDSGVCVAKTKSTDKTM